MSLVLLGSGGFAVPTLRMLAASPHRPVLVVSRPDRPGRRGLRKVPTPATEAARSLGLPLETPPSVNDAAFVERIRALRPEALIAIDYGELLREPVLTVARRGAFNLHGSLLPRWRGASPVTAAIQAGDAESGVTLFRIVRALDAGPILARASTPVGALETAGELEERLGAMAASLLEASLPAILAGSAREEPQRDAEATLAPKLAKGAGAIDWTRPAEEVARFIRALSPRPGGFAFLERPGGGPGAGERFRILRAAAVVATPATDPVSPSGPAPAAGEVARAEKHRFEVACGAGRVEVLEVQPAGRGVLRASELLRGYHLGPGDRFRPSPPEASCPPPRAPAG